MSMDSENTTDNVISDTDNSVSETSVDPIEALTKQIESMQRSQKRFQKSVNDELKMRREQMEAIAQSRQGSQANQTKQISGQDPMLRVLTHELMVQTLEGRGFSGDELDSHAELLSSLEPDKVQAVLKLIGRKGKQAEPTPQPPPQSSGVSRSGPQSKTASKPVRSQRDLLNMNPAERDAWLREASEEEINKLLGA